MSKPITVFVADDHPMLLRGLVDELKEYNYEVVGTAVNGANALEKIMMLKPTVAILDIEMPILTGFEVIKKCKEKSVDTEFIVLSSHKERGFIHKAKTLVILGYILKDEPFKEVHNCIQSVIKGLPYYSSVFNDVLDNEISPQLVKIRLLSPSERTIVRLVAQGQSSKEIGKQLSISYRTVEKHRSNIIAKLGLSPDMDSLVIWTKEHKEFLSDI